MPDEVEFAQLRFVPEGAVVREVVGRGVRCGPREDEAVGDEDVV